MNARNRQSPLLLGFITFSLLLHLLLIFLLPQRNLFPEPRRQKPVVVEVRPPQPTPEPRERELDLPVPPDLETPRETPARRLGPADQVVEKETAPPGDAPEDRRPDAPVPPTTAPKPAQTAPPAERRAQPEQPSRTARPAPEPRAERPGESGPPPRPERAAEPAPPPPAPPATQVPDLNALLELPQKTIARLESEWRRKYRSDVEKGDAVWLDTEKDLLISFFQRFRNSIYGVWNYPHRSRERGEEGTCLLKVSINRDGTLRQVQIMESSGFTALDEQAVEAVEKAGPWGDLSKHYPDEVLNIFAFFEYRLTRSRPFIY